MKPVTTAAECAALQPALAQLAADPEPLLQAGVALLQQLLREAVASRQQYSAEIDSLLWVDMQALPVVGTLTDTTRFQLVLAVAELRVIRGHDVLGSAYVMNRLLKLLARHRLRAPEAAWVRLLRLSDTRRSTTWDGYVDTDEFPGALLLRQLRQQLGKQPPGPALHNTLSSMRNYIHAHRQQAQDKATTALLPLLDQLLGPAEAVQPVQPVHFAEYALQDWRKQHPIPLSRFLNTWVAQLPPRQPTTAAWHRLLALWQTNTGTPPTRKQLAALAAAANAVGPDAVRALGRELLPLCGPWAVQHSYQLDSRTETYELWSSLADNLLEVGRNILWTLLPLADEALLAQVAELALAAYTRTDDGRYATGNAALWLLGQRGMAGVRHLTRLQARLKHSAAQRQVLKYLTEAAEAAGLTTEELADLNVPGFDLREGVAEQPLGTTTARLVVQAGTAELQWLTGGQPRNAPPAEVRRAFPAELKELKARLKEVQQTLSAQRDRLERSLRLERPMPYAWFAQYYLTHPLLRDLTHRLIWRFALPTGEVLVGLWHTTGWQTAEGHPLPPNLSAAQVRLWHPLDSPPEQVLAWQERLLTLELRQPFKQAHREVYVLTPAEQQTRTYSNRMAAHLLRQPPLYALTRQRGWRYQPLLATHADKGAATLALPAPGLTAELDVQALVNLPNAYDAYSFQWHYVSTGQLRFRRAAAAVPLAEVPAVVFSEVMRDVDLLVSVASIGTDPTWEDTGEQLRPYWETYGFGNLSEVSNTRKTVLARLLPRLKLGEHAHIEGNFLHVRGQRHAYKIHLGSGNILVTPHNQYLCIVPDPAAAPALFLPFDDPDPLLSLILSKAQLLRHDDAITDPTILRQLEQLPAPEPGV